jgi:hypothetical protein
MADKVKVIDGETYAEYADGADLLELLRYLHNYAAGIFVRAADPEGKFRSLALTELRAEQVISWTAVFVGRWLADPGYRPSRVKTDEEVDPG